MEPDDLLDEQTAALLSTSLPDVDKDQLKQWLNELGLPRRFLSFFVAHVYGARSNGDFSSQVVLEEDEVPLMNVRSIAPSVLAIAETAAYLQMQVIERSPTVTITSIPAHIVIFFVLFCSTRLT